MAHYNLFLFGSPRLEQNGQPIAINLRKAFALLSYLVVTRQPHSRDGLATLLWPEASQRVARANLRRTIYDLGQLLDEPLLEATPEQVSLQASVIVRSDVEAFQSAIADLLTAGSPAPATGDSSLSRWLEAADLYTADFMTGFTLPDAPEFDDWQFFQREELRRSYATLLQHLVTVYRHQGKFEDAARFARRWLALDPLEEPVHRLLMELYALAGQPAAALRQYEECARILAAELDAPPEAATTERYESIRSKRFPPPQLDVAPAIVQPAPSTPRQASPPVCHLPAQTTPFIGRKAEVAEVVRRLADPHCRLLTLVGPGGIGKTRLAIAAAQQIYDRNVATDDATAPDNLRFDDGLFFVPLQQVSVVSGTIPTIAEALGFQFYEGSPHQQQLLDYLRGKRLLLVLDNFEHLLGGAALIAQIVAASPGVKLLVTSREALKLEEEWFHPLGGMRLPPAPAAYASDPVAGSQENGQALADYDAAQLFIQAARRAQVNFNPQQHWPEIGRICRLVDGMPLGIVLAAAWLKVLSCAQIADEIERGVDILVARSQNVPERHRSMRAVLEHSWALLSDGAQQVLMRLAVFQGGFTQTAATAVANANLLVLTEMVEKTWIYKAQDERYQIHELLRQFAGERLSQIATQHSATCDRHAIYYLEFVAGREQALAGAEQHKALDAISGDIDNIAAAWRWACERHAFKLLERASHALYLFCQTRGRYTEGQDFFATAVAHVDKAAATQCETNHRQADTALRSRLLARWGGCRISLGDLQAGIRDLESALEHVSDARERAFIYFTLGLAERVLSNRPAAEAAYQHSLALARESEDHEYMAQALLGLADTAASFGLLLNARDLAQEALAMCRQTQNANLTSRVLATLAWATNCLGDYAESERYYRESLAVAETIGSPHGIAVATQFLGWVAYCEGGSRLADALPLYTQAMTIFRQTGDRVNLAMSLADYAVAACEVGDYAAAERCAREGLAITEQLNHRDLMTYNLYALGAAARGVGDLKSSRAYLLRSLRVATKISISQHITFAVYQWAQLLVAESNATRQAHNAAATEALDWQAQALAFLVVIIDHPSTWQCVRDRAQRLQATLTHNLPQARVAAAMFNGRRLTLDEVAAQILGNG